MGVLVTKESFDAWRQTERVVFATKWIDSRSGRLRHCVEFVVKLSGGYVVTVASRIQYEGDDFEAAAKAFNEPTEKLK